jgi:hypothetical protein
MAELYCALVKRKISRKEFESIQFLISQGETPCGAVIQVYKAFQERNSFVGTKTSGLPRPENIFGRRKMLEIINEEEPDEKEYTVRDVEAGELFKLPVNYVDRFLGTKRKKIIHCALDRRNASLDENTNVLGWTLSTTRNTDGLTRVSEFPTNIRKIRLQEFFIPKAQIFQAKINSYRDYLLTIRLEEAKSQMCHTGETIFPFIGDSTYRRTSESADFHFIGLLNTSYHYGDPFSSYSESPSSPYESSRGVYKKVAFRSPNAESGRYSYQHEHEAFLLSEFEFDPPLQEMTTVTLSFFQGLTAPYSLEAPYEDNFYEGEIYNLSVMIPMEFECEG